MTDPYEIAKRYAAGDITREQLIEALVSLPYSAKPQVTDGVDTLMVRDGDAASFDDVSRAYRERLIDSSIYTTVLNEVLVNDIVVSHQKRV